MAIERVSVGLDFGDGHGQKREVGTLIFHDFYEKNAFDPRRNRQKVIGFEYAEEFLNNPLPISPFYLPVKQGRFGPFDLPDGSGDDSYKGLAGVFRDSLPGGWGNLLLERLMAVKGKSLAQVTVLERLSLVGSRGMGALTYFPDKSASDKKSGAVIDLSQWSKNAHKNIEGAYSIEEIEELMRASGASEGMRPKAMIAINKRERKSIYGTEELPEGYEAWMVKSSSPSMGDPPDMGLIEYTYSVMAREAGLEMPETFRFPMEKEYLQ